VDLNSPDLPREPYFALPLPTATLTLGHYPFSICRKMASSQKTGKEVVAFFSHGEL